MRVFTRYERRISAGWIVHADLPQKCAVVAVTVEKPYAVTPQGVLVMSSESRTHRLNISLGESRAGSGRTGSSVGLEVSRLIWTIDL